MGEPDSGYIAKMVDGIIIEHDIDLKPFAYTRRAMALAILAERERCKKAVHRAAKDFYGNTDQMHAAALIASAIEPAQ